MKISNKLYIGLIGLSIFATSCDDDSMGNVPNATNTVQIEFDNRFGSTDLVLGTTTATNASGEEYTVSTLNYFVSNVSLMSDMGEMISFPDQYFLVKESDSGSQFIDLPEVPSGNYSHLNFTVGVDSLKSISDVSARTGVLDVASYGEDNMYWSWNMGYIFFKIEGNSDVVDVQGSDRFAFHIGGFGGRDAVTPNNLQEVELHLDGVTVSASNAPQIHVVFDVSKVMDGANTISLAETPAIHNPAVGKGVSQNYVTAFAVDHVH